MKINFRYSESWLKKGLVFLFGPTTFFNLGESRWGKWSVQLCYPIGSEAAVILVLFLIFYKDLLAKYFSFNFSILVPVFLVLAILLADKSKLAINKASVWLLSFLGLSLVSGFIAIGRGLNPKMILLGFLIYVQFLIAFWAGQGILRARLGTTLILVAMPAAVYGIWQYASGAANSRIWFSSFENLNATRAFAWFGSPNVFGIVMSFVAALSLFELLSKKPKSYLFGIPLFISVGALFASYSRSAWLGFGLAVIIVLAIRNYMYLWLAPLSLLLLVSHSIRNRVLALFNPKYLQDASLDGRVWALRNGVYIWKSNPLLGFGPGSYGGQIAQNYASPVYLLGQQNGYTPLYFTDNQWLEVLIQGGLLGLLFWFGFLVAATWQILKNYLVKKDPVFLGALAVLLILVFSGFGANVLEFGAVAIPAGLIIGSAQHEA